MNDTAQNVKDLFLIFVVCLLLTIKFNTLLKYYIFNNLKYEYIHDLSKFTLTLIFMTAVVIL